MTTTTIVYRQEVMSSPNYRNVKTVTTTVKIMGDTKDGGERSPRTRRSTSRSKRKQQCIAVDLAPYHPGAFTITAHLPQDGGKRLKLHCSPGQTVQQVIDTGIPAISQAGYQVYQYPSRALLNPQKDASVLQDQEIWIEPVKPKIDEVDDQRLAVVKELLRTEDSYLENLRNVFDIYMEPLRKWGLHQDDINVLFKSLSKLCDTLMNFFSQLELAVKSWNTDSTVIGGLFQQYPQFWDIYEEYGQNYNFACTLLKEKRKTDEAFNKFLEVKRGAAMHTLESLMLLPVQRITDYHRLLRHLLEITSKNHPDYDSLRCTVATVAAMVQARKQQLNVSQNDIKLEQIQLRFPNEHLCLTEPLEASPMEYKTRSKGSGFSPGPKAQRVKSAPFITMDAIDNSKKQHRLYVQEGPAKMIDDGFQSHNRYLFLFDDLLIVAKPSGRNRSQQRAAYKLKHKLRLSEMWISRCGKEMNANSLHNPATSIFIGWPVTNYITVFSTAEEKELWESLLEKHISVQRQTIQPPVISIRIADYSRTNGNPEWLQVQNTDLASSVLKKATEKFHINDVHNCQLWVSSSREESDALLLGFECPFAIQTYHNRQQRSSSNLGDSKPGQILFTVKRKPQPVGDERPNSNMSSSSSQGRSGKTSRIVEWYRNKKRQNSTESGPSKKKPRMFGAPLEMVIVRKQLPPILEEMFLRLYTEGPSTLGIFRQSANYRKVKELKEMIDNGESVDLPEVSIHTIAALLKELLRNVPGGILQSSRYTEFVATNDIKDVPTRIQQIQKVLKRLPEENQEFLRYLLPLLHFITTHNDVNCMNSINLAICFAPTLLWPDSGLDVIKNEVPPLVQFLVEHSIEIFQDNLPEMYKQFQFQAGGNCNIEIEVLSQGGVNFIPTKIDDGTDLSQNRNNSVDTTTSEDSGDDGEDDEDEPHSNLLTTRTSGLTFSDSQLSHVSEVGRDGNNVVVASGHTGTVCLSGKDIKNTKGQSPSPPPTMRAPKAPERSNSYHSPTEKPRRYKKSTGEYPRRRSTNQHHHSSSRHGGNHSSDLPPVQSSPPSSSSSQSCSPHLRHRRRKSDDSISLSSQLGLPEPTKKNIVPLKTRTRSPHHSNSFNKSPAMRHEKPIPTSSSVSFYDSLSPLPHDSPPENPRIRSRSHGNAHVVNLRKENEAMNVKWPSDSVDPIVQQPSLTHESMHSLVSSRSGSSSSSYPSHDPHTLRPIGGMPRILSSDPLADLEKTPMSQIDKDLLKVAISHRFGIASPLDWRHGGRLSDPPLPKSNSTVQVPSTIVQQEPAKTRSVPAEVSSIEEVQRKLHDRKWLTATAEVPVGKSRSYQNFGGTKPSAQEVFSAADDRPESEQHLHSLPRVADSNKHSTSESAQATPSYDNDAKISGYNSDTESSPSRTLNRQKEKLQEVTSPGFVPKTRLSIPLRSSYQQQQQQRAAEIRPKQSDEPSRSSTTPSFVVSSHPTKSPDFSKEQAGQAVVKQQPRNDSPPSSGAAEATPSIRLTTVTLDKRDSLAGKEGGGDSLVRVDSAKSSEALKSGLSRNNSINDPTKRDPSKVEQVKTDPRSGQIFSKEKAKMAEKKAESTVTDASREQPVSAAMSVEDDKAKIVQRQRSRSITESEKITTARSLSRAEEEKGKRYQDMINGAPTPSERKMWTQQQSMKQMSTKETKVRSLRHNPMEPSKMDSPRSNTLPEPLSTNFSTTIPTFKVVTFEIPGPRPVRKINLRTPQIYC